MLPARDKSRPQFLTSQQTILRDIDSQNWCAELRFMPQLLHLSIYGLMPACTPRPGFAS